MPGISSAAQIRCVWPQPARTRPRLLCHRWVLSWLCDHVPFLPDGGAAQNAADTLQNTGTIPNNVPQEALWVNLEELPFGLDEEDEPRPKKRRRRKRAHPAPQ